MAKPRVFLSSTFYDLKHVREDVARFVKDQGFETVLFERGEVPYGKHEAPEIYCYEEISTSDILVSIIGGRYGADSVDPGYSISQKELRHALQAGKQVYIFVEKNVRAEYSTYKLNKDNLSIVYCHVDDKRVYEFLDEVFLLPRNNPIFDFESPQDIVKILRDQWAGLFQRLLREETERSKAEILTTLVGTASALQDLVKLLVDKFEERDLVVQDLLLLHHPCFARIKQVLSIPYRVVFFSVAELSELIKARNYTEVPEELWDDGGVMEWIKNHNGTQFILKIDRSLFDAEGRLRPVTPDQFNDSQIRVERNEIEIAATEEMPF